jgi:hypothetical protein
MMLREFLDNCSRQTYTDIKDKIQEIMNKNKVKSIKVTCTNTDCATEYETAIEFDQANFFA